MWGNPSIMVVLSQKGRAGPGLLETWDHGHPERKFQHGMLFVIA